MIGGVRGLGANNCTPQSCDGPYDNPVYNYDYWMTQGETAGVVTPTTGTQSQGINTTAIQNAAQWV